ncbi:MAG: DUF3788 domain-containing protein [Promethearchaeota archaeon]
MAEELHQRMYDRTREPTDTDIISFISDSQAVSAWNQLMKYMDSFYDLAKEVLYYGDRYGWLVRYRKSKRTIVSMFPETNSFSFLIIYGKNEIDKFENQKSDFLPSVVDVFEKTEKLHDGKWLWIRVKNTSVLEDLKKLIAIKRKPNVLGQTGH